MPRVTAYYSYLNHNKPKPDMLIQGSITQLLPDTIYVPREYHHLIQRNGPRRTTYYGWNYQTGKPNLPHYQVTLDYGKRYEPWIESVMPEIPAP